MHFLEKYFLFFLKIGRKSISTGSPGRSRPPEFKKITKSPKNSQNMQNDKKHFFNCRPPLIFLTAFNH